MFTFLRRLPIAALFYLLLLPLGRAETTFSLYFNSESEGVMSYEECRLKEAQKVYYDCASNLGIKLIIYASPSGACTNTPGTDAIILLSERIVSTASECTGTLSIDPSDIVGEDCPCHATKSLQLCAATKYQAYNYETLLTEWVEDETISLALSYDSKPPTVPTLSKIEPGDEALYLNFSGPSDITEWVACVEVLEASPESEASADADVLAAAALDLSAIAHRATGDGLTRQEEEEVLDDGEEETCEVGTSPFVSCDKIATFSGSGTSRGVVRGLVNGQAYRVTLAGRDAAGNYSPASQSLEGTPMDVQDFFEAYIEAGGSEEGGFGCSSAGRRPVSIIAGLTMFLALAGGARSHRRRGQQVMKGGAADSDQETSQ